MTQSPLEWSGLICFVTVAVWLGLRAGVFVHERFFSKAGPRQFPISAQRMGFAQWIGEWSPIISEYEYEARLGRYGFIRMLAKAWWPLVALAGVIQFLLFFGAKGLETELGVSYSTGLMMSFSALGILGVIKKDAISDHFKRTFPSEGRPLDWDDEAFFGGIRARVRFEGSPRKILMTRTDENALGKDGEVFYRHGIAARPDSVHWHGAGIVCSEFRHLDTPNERMTKAEWTGQVKMRDAVHAVISAFVVSGDQKAPVCAFLEYPGAAVQLYPLAEHVEFFSDVAERLKKRKKIPTIAAKEVALAATQEFPSRFDATRISMLLEQNKWVSKRDMPL